MKQTHFHNGQERILLAEAQSSQSALPKTLNSLRLCEENFFILAPAFSSWVFGIKH